jgi:hypothetical protein
MLESTALVEALAEALALCPADATVDALALEADCMVLVD